MRVDKSLYPFEGRTFDRDGIKLHYLDEGAGETVVMLHGNPTWSFYYRELVKSLRVSHRVIVPDHIGCGFSEKPDDSRYDYTLKSRVDDLEALLGHLGLSKDLTLVVHDWGGAIGMAFACRNPGRIKRMVLFNTAAFLTKAGSPVPWPIRLARASPWGALFVRGLNGFALGASYTCSAKPLPSAVRSAYTAPYRDWASRIAVLRFVQDIPLGPRDKSYALMAEVDGKLKDLAAIPALICWGGKDFVFTEAFLDEWKRRLPRAEVKLFPDAGHFVLEDAIDEIVPLVRGFLGRN